MGNNVDLISRESLLRHVGSVDDAKADAEADPELSEAIKWLLVRCVEHAVSVINAEPTVDAVEVVRCKDCRYSRGMNDAEQKLYIDEVLICTSGDMGTGVECPVFQNDYCSYGERKDGADNGKAD